MRALALVPAPGSNGVPHARPSLGREEEAAALRVLRSGRLAPGKEAARLETLVARMAGAADALAVSSGTMSLTLALRALGLRPRDAVAVPSYTCMALLHAVRAVPARPLVCDVDPETLCLDPQDLRRRAGRTLRAVVVVHPFGHPAEAEDCRVAGAHLVEDCAQSPGAVLRGAPVGARGDAAVFSFAPTKLVTCGGPGGALASSSARLVARARDLAEHDEKDDATPRLNGLMGDLHAAIAAAQIERIGDLVARRSAIASLYDAAFEDRGWARPRMPAGARCVSYRYLLRIPRGASRLLDGLQASGIMARRPVFRPLHELCHGTRRCPGAKAAHLQWISLPLFSSMSDGDVEQVISAVLRCRS
jgi:dTDP-4-amino-4,6-dideoxygalactose transaminase